ncbi:MAG: pyroglutamyl-peptidase I [Mesorhizobium sp.]|nr:pyroglutamyl-peptidase I [Mesorhizobium sp.]
MSEGPRLLVTGFGPFPGAPDNPTAWLVSELAANPPSGEGIAAFHAEMLDVEYDLVGPRLSQLGASFAPDIAIHFGLAAEASGFRLERVARNSHAGARPDNAGRLPPFLRICDGPETLPSTLPLEAIAEALTTAGLPVEWSDDAGGYLCNTVFVLSRFHACEGFQPAMSGFVHVPLLAGQAGARPGAMNADDLLRGARLIIAATLAAHKG